MAILPEVRSNSTGLSRQFAFAQFAGIPEAKAFLTQYYPTITLYGPYDPNKALGAEGAKIRIAFSREKDERALPGKSDDDWKCECVRPAYDLIQRMKAHPYLVQPHELLTPDDVFPLQCSQN